MRKLHEVEEASELMTEAMGWSVFTWLFQKSKVRDAADRANAALDQLNKTTKARWSEDLKAAYKAFKKGRPTTEPAAITLDIREFLEKLKAADEAARRAREDAETTFAEAERQLNTALAKEGCRKALHQWELDAKAIRYAEALPAPAKPSK